MANSYNNHMSNLLGAPTTHTDSTSQINDYGYFQNQLQNPHAQQSLPQKIVIDMIDPDFYRKATSSFEESPKDILSRLRKETKEFCKNVKLK